MGHKENLFSLCYCFFAILKLVCSLKTNLLFFSHGNKNTCSYKRVQINGSISPELMTSFMSGLAVLVHREKHSATKQNSLLYIHETNSVNIYIVTGIRIIGEDYKLAVY